LNPANPSLWSLTAAQLLDEVASRQPTPGGGSVCIVAGTLGLALVHKGIAVSLKRHASDTAMHALLVELGVKLASSMKTLSALADEDSNTFESYLAARALPHGTVGEVATREVAILNGLQRATEVPLQAAEEMVNGLVVAELAMDLAVQHVMSDIVAGAMFLHAAIQGVLLNVGANVSGISDAAQRDLMKSRRIGIEHSAEVRWEAINRKCRASPIGS
jgi:formiminotetrahydrofolate cyclodeaminase